MMVEKNSFNKKILRINYYVNFNLFIGQFLPTTSQLNTRPITEHRPPIKWRHLRTV